MNLKINIKEMDEFTPTFELATSCLGYQPDRNGMKGSLIHRLKSFADLRAIAKGKTKDQLPPIFPSFGKRGSEFHTFNVEPAEYRQELVELYKAEYTDEEMIQQYDAAHTRFGAGTPLTDSEIGGVYV